VVDRESIQQAMKAARGTQRAELAFKEALHLLIEDKNALAAAELFKEVAEADESELGKNARLLLGHAYRAQGKRRTAIFTYQRLARAEQADDTTVMALIALVEIGDTTVAKVAAERLEELRAQDSRPAAIDLLDAGETLTAIEKIYTDE
jgi:lipopolysaccharide biosynthesis regulator YciM